VSEHVDVLIVGAGLSGIGAARHLQASLPGKTYTILEARDVIGGTWDLFRYPGVRSDSDMYTLGYRFRPWTQGKAIADGPSILRYVRDTAAEAGIGEHVRFGHRVIGASWSSADAQWTVRALHGAETVTMTCGFLLMCSGYYRYDQGYLPSFPGIGGFRGRVVHPQHWPADLDYAGRRVVVIGSGATDPVNNGPFTLPPVINQRHIGAQHVFEDILRIAGATHAQQFQRRALILDLLAEVGDIRLEPGLSRETDGRHFHRQPTLHNALL